MRSTSKKAIDNDEPIEPTDSKNIDTKPTKVLPGEKVPELEDKSEVVETSAGVPVQPKPSIEEEQPESIQKAKNSCRNRASRTNEEKRACSFH